MSAIGAVLVVEDSDEDFDTVAEAARHSGVKNTLHRAINGEACLTLLRGTEILAPLKPSLLLLDLTASGLDGRDALASIRAELALRWFPVVVVSASSNPRDLAFCYAQGANAYHVKPVRYPDHLKLLDDVLRYWLTLVALPDASRLTP